MLLQNEKKEANYLATYLVENFFPRVGTSSFLSFTNEWFLLFCKIKNNNVGLLGSLLARST